MLPLLENYRRVCFAFSKVYTIFTRLFLQLPEFTKEADECENDSERWIYVLKNMEVLDRMSWVAKDYVFHRLVEIAEVSNMTKEECIKYNSALRHYRDAINVMRGAEDNGVAKGMMKGKTEVAKKLKTMGLPIKQISQATGLTANEIKAL